MTPRSTKVKAGPPGASERGAVHKPRGGRTTICLVYPNTYHVGMSSLGYQSVYRMINERDDALAERAFLPGPGELEQMLDAGKPLFATESRTPASEFEMLAFSVSYENDYTGVVDALRLCKLPPLAKDRSASHPMVVLGGISTFFNPEPIAPFFDAVIVGEAEGVLDEFLDAYEAGKLRLERPELLAELSKIPGVYIPSMYTPEYHPDGTLESFTPAPGAPGKIERRCAPDLDARPATSVILTPDTEFSDMYMVELSRGCGRHCRFCMAGYVYRPPRSRSLESVKRDIREGAKLAKKVGLVGAAVSDYPGIEELAREFAELDVSFSASSLRADSLTPELVALVAKGNRTVAIAPEAGSQRMRSVINKNITEKQVLDAVKMLIDGGILNVRLYFMVGLPTETGEDVDAIVELAKKAHETQLAAAKKKGRIGTLTLSVNCFIPKPWTPFQWEPMPDVDTLKAKLSHIKKSLKGVPNVSVIHDVPKWAWLQGVLARGDRRLSGVLVRASESGGNWKRAFADEGLDMGFYAGRERGEDELFPWDFLDTRIKKSYLLKECARAKSGKPTNVCDVDKCRACGVC